MDGSQRILGDYMSKSIYLDHIGIATHNLDDASVFWNLIGLSQGEEDEIVEDQGVKTRFFSTSENDSLINSPKVELLEPTSVDTPIGKFLQNRGPGIQQMCFRVENLVEMIELLVTNGVLMIDEQPRIGAGGKQIAFVHPKSTGGVLVELTQYD